MPEIDDLMQEWPPEFEELLKTVGLPTADIDCDLGQYVEILCALLDIPIYQSKIQALHVLFTLYSEFKNSQVMPQYNVQYSQKETPKLNLVLTNLGWNSGQIYM